MFHKLLHSSRKAFNTTWSDLLVVKECLLTPSDDLMTLLLAYILHSLESNCNSLFFCSLRCLPSRFPLSVFKPKFAYYLLLYITQPGK